MHLFDYWSIAKQVQWLSFLTIRNMDAADKPIFARATIGRLVARRSEVVEVRRGLGVIPLYLRPATC